MTEILGLLICFGIGGLLKHYWGRSDILRGIINKYLIYFGLPFFIVVSLIVYPSSQFWNYVLVFFLFLIITSFLFFFLVKKMKASPARKGAIFLCTAYANWGYLGIPTAYVLFGVTGLIIASIFTLIASLVHYSLGIFLSNLYAGSHKMAMQRVLKTPLIYGLIIAFLLSQLSLELPRWLFEGASSAIYLAGLVVGLSVSLNKVDRSLINGAVLKFGLWPILVFLLLVFQDFSLIEKKILLLLAFLPPAMINTSFAIEYKLDFEWASNFTTIATIGFLIGFFIIFFCLL